MKRKTVGTAARIFIALLASMLALTAAGCSTAPPATTLGATTDVSTGAPAPTSAGPVYKDKITVDVFAQLANYQGIQGGWFGKLVLDKFNMELNIIAPNVAGGGDSLFLTRSAAGNLGDLVCMAQDKLPDAVKAGLFMDITSLMPEHCPVYLSKFPKAIKKVQDYLGTDKIYAFATDCTEQSPLTPNILGTDPAYGPYLRFDYYTGIGSPKIATMDDLLQVLKQMQEKYPTSESGKPTYGFSFFKDWDGGVMQNAGMFAFMYGYAFKGSSFLYGDPASTVLQSIIDDNGIYLKTLKLYFQANQMGLVDPDSTAQNWDTLTTKVKDGQVLFSWWPWLGKSSFNTLERSEAGQGFMLIPIEDEKILCDGFNPSGGQFSQIAGIGSKAKDPGRILDYVNWTMIPEGLEYTAGPKGLTWEIKDGRPTLTEYGKQVVLDEANLEVPAEYGGGTYGDGAPQILNFELSVDTNPNTGEPYDSLYWKSTIESTYTNLDRAWAQAFASDNAMAYLKTHGQVVVAPGNSYAPPADSTDIQTKRAQCSQAVINASWQMIFAKDEAEFNRIWEDLKTQLKGFGYDDVIAWDTKVADEMNAARRKTQEEAGK